MARTPSGGVRQATRTVRNLRSEISLGDLARAVTAAGGRDPQTIATIANLLGFGIEQSEPEAQTEEPQRAPVDELPPRPLEPTHPAYQAESARDRPAFDLPTEENPQYSVAEPDIVHIPPPNRTIAKSSVSWPAWDLPRRDPRYRPLFRSQWTRGILSETAITWRAAGAADIPRALELLARSSTPAVLPRLHIPTLARGCQVLVDVSAGMGPFARDSSHLVDELRSVVGREQVQVLYFKDCPIYGVRTEEELRSVTFTPPPAATPVLLLTDLGISSPPFSLRRAVIQDWLRLATRMQEAKCPLLALVPYPHRRWPRKLQKALTIIEWDRSVTATAVRRAKEASSHA